MSDMRLLGPCLCVLLVGACSFDRSGPANGGTATDAADAPMSMADAMVDGSPDAMLCASACAGDVLKGCNGDPDQTCDLGCSTSPTPHCKQVVPSNSVSLGGLSGVTGPFDTMSSQTGGQRREYTIDTDTGEILDYGDGGYPTNTQPTTVRGAGIGVRNGLGFATPSNLAVLSVDSMHLAADSVVYGFGSRPLVILSRGDVLIEGAIDFSAGCYQPDGTFDTGCGGAGGGAGATAATAAGGCGPGGNGSANHFTGGGGGGMGTDGGHGGDFSMGNLGGLAGSAAGCPNASLEPLTGGGGGGIGGGDQGGPGGGGGGALQITSLTSITISHPGGAAATTEIYAAGAGGTGTPADNKGGGGGGAGGGVLLEAPAVTISATVTANGGGGGGGRPKDNDGAYGTHDTSQALGGAGGGPAKLDGAGGLGGALLGNAGAGLVNGDGTGGGGGAVGRIRINTPTSSANLVGATISPSASQGMLVIQ